MRRMKPLCRLVGGDPHRDLAPTFTHIEVLAAVILTRTCLSSLAVKMEGRWYWQPKAITSPEVVV